MIVLSMGARGDDWLLPKSTWKRAAKSDGTLTAMIACPECGREGSLSDHSIGPDGIVTPSVVCGYFGCSFHDWVKLEGWLI